MEDLIRRSDAIEAIEGVDWYHQNSRNKDMANGANSDEHQAWYKADDVYKALKEVPSADRPRGEWIEVRAFDAFGGDEAAWMAHDNPIAFHYCSECKEQTRLDEFGEEMLSKYCPNCGARMKGADDE